MSTCKAVVLAVILALCTGISRGQCPATCQCYGTDVECRGQQLLTIPLSLPDATTTLGLYNNSIASLPADALQRLTNLNALILDNNSIASLHADAFQGLSNLQYLSLYGNRLRNISRAMFRGLAKLRELQLSSNQLESIEDGAFEGMPDLNVMHLSSNRIGNISRAAFSDLPQLTFLYLDKNPLVCDCHLRWLIVTAQAGESNVTVTNAVCSEPAHLKGREIRNVALADLNCSVFDTIEIVKAPNAIYDVEPNMTIVIAIDFITDPDWQNQITYKWFWYLPITTSTGNQIIEKQPLPPISSYDKYFKLSLSGKELTFTIPDVKTPVMADNTAEYDLYQDLTDDRLFSINISHKFDHRVVNFTVKGKELDIKKASTPQAHVYIGIGLGAVVLVVIAAVIIFMIQKRRRRHNTPSLPMADPALTPINAHRDEHEYAEIEDDTETCLQSNVQPIQGATSSTDDGYLTPMTAKL